MIKLQLKPNKSQWFHWVDKRMFKHRNQLQMRASWLQKPVMGTLRTPGLEEPGGVGGFWKSRLAEGQGHIARRTNRRPASCELRKEGPNSPASYRMPHHKDIQSIMLRVRHRKWSQKPDGYHFHATKPDALARDQYFLPRWLSLGRKDRYHPYQRFTDHCSEGRRSHDYRPPSFPQREKHTSLPP